MEEKKDSINLDNVLDKLKSRIKPGEPMSKDKWQFKIGTDGNVEILEFIYDKYGNLLDAIAYKCTLDKLNSIIDSMK